MIGFIFGVGLLLVTLVVVGVIVALRLSKQPKFTPLPGWVGVTYTSFAPSVDADKIGRALSLAVSAVLVNADISKEVVWSAVGRCTIVVQPVDSWLNVFGVRVGGEENAFAITTNASLTSLCHELCHAIEEQLTSGFTDAAHTSWGRRGLWAADNAYRAALGY